VLCDTRPWVKVLDDGRTVTVFDFEWRNPSPQKEIATIHLSLLARNPPFSVFVYDIRGLRLRRGSSAEEVVER